MAVAVRGKHSYRHLLQDIMRQLRKTWRAGTATPILITGDSNVQARSSKGTATP